MPAKVVIVGGGIAGLSAAFFLHRESRGMENPPAIEVVEAAPRFGGKILTEEIDGFLVEAGPDSFISRKPEALDLARELGLEGRVLHTREENRRVYVLRKGRLMRLPEGLQLVIPSRLGPVMRSPLLSIAGRIRLAMDLIWPRRRGGGDESLAAFFKRRFGREALERFASPLLAGIYATDPEELSVAATFPRLAALERRHGSLIRGIRAAHAALKPSPVSGRITFRRGVGELVEALVERLGEVAPEDLRLRTGARVRTLEEGPDGGYRLSLAGGTELRADAVVLAVPAFAMADLLREIAPAPAAELREIRYASSASVSLGFRREDVGRPLDAYGFLIPRGEGRRITACTWTSTKFEARAPAGYHLLRVFIGGAPEAGHGDPAGLDDPGLIALARRELAEILGIEAAPAVSRIHRWERGNPQYRVGHPDRVAAIENGSPPGVVLAGSALHGVGIPDCVRSGRSAAETVLGRFRKANPGG